MSSTSSWSLVARPVILRGRLGPVNDNTPVISAWSPYLVPPSEAAPSNFPPTWAHDAPIRPTPTTAADECPVRKQPLFPGLYCTFLRWNCAVAPSVRGPRGHGPVPCAVRMPAASTHEVITFLDQLLEPDRFDDY